MTVGELKSKLSQYNDGAEIISYNRTSRRWFKTGTIDSYPISTVGETSENCNEYAKNQLKRFDSDDVTFFF